MFSNWKTTLAGLGIASLNLFANGMHPKQIGMSIGLAILGSICKDFNVTGGAVQQ